jgi:hypothetical protein
LPHLIQDRHYLRDDGEILLATPFQSYSAPDDGQFTDGPAHPRVAVVDLDAETCTLRAPARFRAKARGKTVSEYDLAGLVLDPDAEPDACETDEFLKLNPFATVLKTLAYFESAEILGRQIRWAFPSEQLLIVPRAGVMKNAFYDRSTGSLQFYEHGGRGGFTIYTALSHDIIVHETTHAIIDAVAPDLYHAADPQSLALHEALADLSAITQTLLNEMVVFSLDAISGSSVEPLEALSRLAEEFGSDVRQDQGGGFLRRLKNRRSVRPDDDSVDEFGIPNRPSPTDPHALSQVLAGAVYTVFERRIDVGKEGRRSRSGFQTLDEALCPAARRVSRIVFRALDYLPPGEVGFVDYGRAFLAAADSTYRRPGLERETLCDEFVSRGIVDDPAALEQPPPPDLALDGRAVEKLTKDRAALKAFVSRFSDEFHIPDDVEPEIEEPIIARRSLKSTPSAKRRREFIFRIRWTEAERRPVAGGLPGTWSAMKGTTLVVGEDGQALSLLTSEPGRAAERTKLLDRWLGEGRLRLAADAVGPDGAPLRHVVTITETGGSARALGGGQTLHVARDLT